MGHERFDHTIHRGELVRIFWEGRCIMTIGGERGRDLAAKLAEAGDAEAQRLLQRATGNFKRGNERS